MRSKSQSKLHDMYIERWSPRAFSSDPISEEDMHTMFEAARWSPSCFNEQPWHFVYATTDEDLQRFQSILVEGNQVWANHAPVLMIAFSKKTFSRNDKPNRWADFDTGAAWMALTLQANQLGLHTHAMGGFDQEQAYQVANVDPEKYNVICVIAVGKKTDPESLPQEIRENETPNNRNSLAVMISEGKMT